ncbi:MAG: DNA-deoxyinosine glycosylase [Bacilli bacterium]|nr:DNA-deoxyinosine glycosylase [Bacilli bacterium]
MLKRVYHPYGPIYDANSKILFVGTIASVKSREHGYPYSSPYNRFWRVLEVIFNEKITDHKKFLLKHNIALWDSIHSCDIKASSDASIKNIKVNQIWEITKDSNIKVVFTNGKKAYEVYQKYIYPKTNIRAICLPSSSPAHAIKRLEDLVEDYKIILDYL